jgi:hypothetical protein
VESGGRRGGAGESKQDRIEYAEAASRESRKTEISQPKAKRREISQREKVKESQRAKMKEKQKP